MPNWTTAIVVIDTAGDRRLSEQYEETTRSAQDALLQTLRRIQITTGEGEQLLAFATQSEKPEEEPDETERAVSMIARAHWPRELQEQATRRAQAHEAHMGGHEDIAQKMWTRDDQHAFEAATWKLWQERTTDKKTQE